MKVLQINSVCGYGSTGKIATDIHKILEEQGHKCLIAYGRGTAPKGINSIKIGTNFNNYMHVAKTRLFDLHGFGSADATREFIEIAKEYDPDVIHLHNIHGYYINIEILFQYLKEANKPVVWTLHDCWSFTGHCSHFDYSRCEKWKIQCFNCPQKNKYPRSIIVDNSINNYIKKKEIFTGLKNLTLVSPSKWLAGLVKESFLQEYNVLVINNGIDLNVFKPSVSDFRQIHGLNDKFIILGVASVWEERKGFKYFLELSNKLSEKEIIVLIGLTEKQKKQLPENIIGITRTNNINELVQIYSVADVFINLTLEDNFPTTNIESLACGTPVITFNTGGSIESIDKNVGYVVEQGNVDKLVEKIIKIKENGKNMYSLACINKAYSLYDKNERFSEYLKIYLNKL